MRRLHPPPFEPEPEPVTEELRQIAYENCVSCPSCASRDCEVTLPSDEQSGKWFTRTKAGDNGQARCRKCRHVFGVRWE